MKKELELIQHLASFYGMKESVAKQFDFIAERYLHKGHTLMGMKDFSQVMVAFNKVLQIQPNNQIKKKRK